MENALYYTLSTISQTLAGALGLLAAFMIIRLTGIAQQLEKHFENLQTADDPEWHRARFRSDYATLLRLAESAQDKLAANGRTYHLPVARELVTARSGIIASLLHYLVVTAALILACVLGLSWAPELAQTGAPARVLLAMAALAVLYCLQGYVRLIMKAIP